LRERSTRIERPTATGFRILAAFAATIAVSACSTTVQPPGGRLTASQQILTTDAIDRALGAQVRTD